MLPGAMQAVHGMASRAIAQRRGNNEIQSYPVCIFRHAALLLQHDNHVESGQYELAFVLKFLFLRKNDPSWLHRSNSQTSINQLIYLIYPTKLRALFPVNLNANLHSRDIHN
jgi:hypothetical protein